MTIAASAAAAERAYPVRVDATIDEPLSRWKWLVKWLLAIPHCVVLLFLWVAFVLLTVAAWFAILATGRYPRSIFDFNTGVIRWTWRVSAYAWSPLSTDRYPPFTLADLPDYPATIEIPYPEQLSRGLALVKSWLFAIPHLIVVAILTGGWLGWTFSDGNGRGEAPGLITVLTVIAAVVLLVKARYPRDLFELVLGLNRWAFRVLAYVALMRDEYPPFRLSD